MKITAISAAAIIAFSATSANAGGLLDEVVETPVISPVVVEDDSTPLWIPLLALVAVAAVAAGSSGGGS